MGQNLFIQNALSPPILFFFLGAIAYALKSDFEIPAPLPKLFSLYLLLAIGFKGGIELQKSNFGYPVSSNCDSSNSNVAFNTTYLFFNTEIEIRRF